MLFKFCQALNLQARLYYILGHQGSSSKYAPPTLAGYDQIFGHPVISCEFFSYSVGFTDELGLEGSSAYQFPSTYQV